MNLLKSVTALAVILFSAVSAFAQFEKAELQVSGLTCSMCQLATQKSLKTIDFIDNIKPNLNTGTYELTFKSNKPVDLDLIRKKVKDAGFSVSRLVAVFNFDKVAISNNFHYSFGGHIYHFMDVPSKILEGKTRLTVISNGFIPASQYKKYAGSTTFPCYKSGVMGKDKVIHVTI